MNRTKIEWTDYEKGWLSGLIDGEGSISLLKERRSHFRSGYAYKPRLNISNKNLNLIKKAQNLIGGCITQNKKSNVFNLDVSANNIRSILPKIKLIVKERKRQLILQALDILSARHRGKNHPMTDNEISQLEEIYLEMRK